MSLRTGTAERRVGSRGPKRETLFAVTLLAPVAVVVVLAAARVASRHADALRLALQRVAQTPEPDRARFGVGKPAPSRDQVLFDVEHWRTALASMRYDGGLPLDPLAAEYEQALRAVERERAGAPEHGVSGSPGDARRAEAPIRPDTAPAQRPLEPAARQATRPAPARVAAAREPMSGFARESRDTPDVSDAEAGARAREGRLGEAEASYRQVLATRPNDVQAMLGLAGVLAREGRDEEARALLTMADDLGGGSDARDARAGALREKAQRAPDAATRAALYREALTLQPADPWIRLDLARSLTVQGRLPEARELMSSATGTQAGADDLTAGIIFAGETGDAVTASALIARLPFSARTVEMRSLQADAQLRSDIAALSALPPSSARQRLLALATAPDPDGSRGAAIARALGGMGDVAGARAALTAAQSSTPGAPVAARLNYAAAYLDIGDVTSARRLFDSIDVDTDLTLAQRPAYAQLGATLALSGAGSLAGTGGLDGGTRVSSGPTPRPVLATDDSARQASTIQADYRYRRVLDTSATALRPPEAPGDGSAPAAGAPDQTSASLGIGAEMKGDQGGITGQAALAIRYRSDDNGLGRLTELTSPLEAEYSPAGYGQLKLSVVPTALIAGRIGTDAADSRRLGAQALSFGPAPGSRSEHTAGVGLNVAYTLANLNADLGATPLGFATQHVVGGLSYAPVLADGVRLLATLERRAVTDSVLSYAGMRDPTTGTTWGGEVRTRGRADVQFDVWRGRAYVGAGGGVVTGTGTPRNSETEAGAGVSFPVYSDDSRMVSVGLDLAYSGYARNLRYYTLGQGGYFSPQSYLAALLPVRLIDRITTDLSLEVGVALGAQHYHETASVYYPADQALQARLVSSAGGLPTAYPAHTLTGPAGNGHASIDYRPMPNLHLGAVLSAQRAGDFTEASGVAYARYVFGAEDP